jgi:subtilisin family serine protease
MAGAAAHAQDGGPISSVPSSVRDLVRDSYIFVFDASVSPAGAGPRARGLVQRAGGSLRHVYSTAIRGFAAKMPAAAAARLVASNPNIAYYHPDGVAFAVDAPQVQKGRPPGKGPGGGGPCEAQVIPSGVSRAGGPFEAAGLGSIWIIDTGVDLEHPDLNVDLGRSATFVGGKNADDKNGHGTHVAGTAAAINNDCQVVGLAAGATVVAVKVLKNSGSGSFADIIAGVDYAAAGFAPGDSANMSLRGIDTSGTVTALDDAVRGAAGVGLLFAIAAGNDSRDTADITPARVEHPNVITVSAVNNSDAFANFSNFGAAVDYAAPGVGVLSLQADGETAILSGTSMAAPHVAGILLIDGMVCGDGTASGDPDGNADPIAHLCP